MFDAEYFRTHINSQIEELGAGSTTVEVRMKSGTVYTIRRFDKVEDEYLLVELFPPEGMREEGKASRRKLGGPDQVFYDKATIRYEEIDDVFLTVLEPDHLSKTRHHQSVRARIWTVEDYYRAKEFYESHNLVFNPALEVGSPAAYHVIAQAQLQAIKAKEQQQLKPEPQATKKRFRVALSFPGEHRDLVCDVAARLAKVLERAQVFYDEYHKAELARLDLDTYLQRIYHDESDLLVVFICADYETKEWCGLEWRAIRGLIKTKEAAVIMPIRVDKGDISGLFSIDGYINAEEHSADELAELIMKRLRINDSKTE